MLNYHALIRRAPGDLELGGHVVGNDIPDVAELRYQLRETVLAISQNGRRDVDADRGVGAVPDRQTNNLISGLLIFDFRFSNIIIYARTVELVPYLG
jgi:hypothetical protein